MKRLTIIAFMLVFAPLMFAAVSTEVAPCTDILSTSPVYIVPVQAIPNEALGSRQVEDSIYYCSLTNYTGIGLTAGGTFELAIRLKPAQLGPFAGYNIIALIFYHYDGTSTGGYAKIYDQGSATQPGPVLNSTAYTGGITGWQRIDLSAPVPIGGTTDLWCSVEVTHPSGGYPGGCDAGPTIVDADWIYFSGAWGTLGGYGLPYNWQLLAIVTQGTTYTHDVGATAILAPPAQVMTGSTLNPSARYRNFGTSAETFAAHFEIDSAGTTIYTQTVNVTRQPGTDTVLTFPSWTAATGAGVVYDVTAYTVLAGDQNPANDTVTSQCTTVGVYWEILSATLPVGSSGHSMVTAHDGTTRVFGMHPSGVWEDTTYIYDIASNTWLGGPNNPYGPASYGTVDFVNGRYFRIGGYTGSAGVNRVDIYDPVAGWSAGAAAPTAMLVDHMTGVYKDSLIYTLGNGNWFSNAPSTGVYYYDTYNNAWGTATSIPGTGRGCNAAGIVDSFAVIACGYMASGAYANDYAVGIINAANPATITWGAVTAIPGAPAARYRVPSGTDMLNGEVYFTCGQISGGSATDIWSYDPYNATWTNWNTPKPHGVGNMTPVAITVSAMGDFGVYVAGGYAGGAYVNYHELYHTGTVPGVAERPSDPIGATTFGFATNMANPVKGTAGISYTTLTQGPVMVTVYDGAGRIVRTLVDRVIEPAGSKTVYWDNKDDSKRDVSEGIYFVRLEAEGKTASVKLVVVK